ncbi:MAG: glutamate-5-semialdehyde dehydrogenase [Alphaproteobacteria bacterium]|nr:glutamate-5-semialdehyde dehydrogenase [Alphaproteobacteria bacterium]
MALSNNKTKNLDIESVMLDMGSSARTAGRILAQASSEDKDSAILAGALEISNRRLDILAANEKDLQAGLKKGLSDSLIDRLKLDNDRIGSIVQGLEEVASLTDPVGVVLDEWDRPNGLKISRVRVALGVIGIIYESRPNVTADAGGLCLKAGNAAILRGGSDTFHTSEVILQCMQHGLSLAGLPITCLQAPPTTDRRAVGAMLSMNDFIDVIVPRGGKSLVERVQNEARMPVFAHLEGLCHTYVHEQAELQMVRSIIINAKMRRTSICGATETILIDHKILQKILSPIVDDLTSAGCEVRGDELSKDIDSRVTGATAEDWDTEYLDSIVSVKVVDGIDDAINHINHHGSNHTDAIITNDNLAAKQFLEQVDSGIVMHNTSTQFADGGEFGMGAEIGISTGRLHARGPVGAEQLTTYKYIVRGSGQVRA